MKFSQTLMTKIFLFYVNGLRQPLSDFNFVSDENREYVWDPELNPDGDFGWSWYFKYNNHVPGYTENQLKDIVKTVDNCNTTGKDSLANI